MNTESQLTLLDYIDLQHVAEENHGHDVQEEFDKVIHDVLEYSDAPRIFSIVQSDAITHHLIWETKTEVEWAVFMRNLIYNTKIAKAVEEVASKLGVSVEDLDVEIIQLSDTED